MRVSTRRHLWIEGQPKTPCGHSIKNTQTLRVTRNPVNVDCHRCLMWISIHGAGTVVKLKRIELPPRS